MKKNWVKKSLITLGILAIIFVIANFGLNFWLKYRLPVFIENNSDYTISYKSLDVDLKTGNILATGITVSSKNPEDTSAVGLYGTIGILEISRFGIFDAIFKKQISSSDVFLLKPRLNIVLADSVKNKKAKKRESVNFENIRIDDGEIVVLKPNKQKILGVNHLDFVVKNLSLAKKSDETQLPFTFDEYNIKANNFFFRPNDIYTINIKDVTTKNGQMLIDEFSLQPLISFDDFKKLYPYEKQYLKANIQKINVKNITLKDHQFSISDVVLDNPSVQISTKEALVKTISKKIGFNVDLGNLKLNNLTLQINQSNGQKKFYSEGSNFMVNQVVFNEETSKAAIPFRYSDFKFSGNNIQYNNDGAAINLENVLVDSKRASINNVSVISENKSKLKIPHIEVDVNKLAVVDGKLQIDINRIGVDNLNGVFKSEVPKSKKKHSYDGIMFPIVIRNVDVKNSNVVYDKRDQPLVFKNLNASFIGIAMTPKKDNSGLATSMKDFKISTQNFAYKTKYYKLSVGSLNLSKNKIIVNQFAMTPLYSRAKFIKMIPIEKDLYTIKVEKVVANGTWDFLSANKYVNAKSVIASSVNANIFRSKIPPDDPKTKLMYSAMLRDIKIPLYISQFQINDSYLEYEEDTPKSSGPGKIYFSNFNLVANNINSTKFKGKPTDVGIKINCNFMGVSPMTVNWGFNTINKNDAFTISGDVYKIPATSINSFIVPYLSISAEGNIQEMMFNFNGNSKNINGTFNLKYDNLKISILNRKDKQKRNFLSALVNIFIKSSSGKMAENVTVTNVKRDPTKSFFNLFWRGIEDGLKLTLIGKNANKTEQSIKETINSVNEIKASLKDDAASKDDNTRKKTRQQKKEERKEKREQKNGFFNRIF